MENYRLEKYNNKRSSHLGSLIKELVDAGGFTVNDVATYIDVSEEELDIIYDSNSIDVEIIIKLAELLQHNLFIYYLDNEVIRKLFENHVNDLNPQISYLIGQLETKNDQIAQLKALNETQRKTIEMLETKDFLQNTIE
jgi:hypothetical protein